MEKRSSLFTAASLRRAEDRRGYQTVRGACASLWNTVLTKEQLPRNLNSSNGMRLYEIDPLIGWSSRKRVSFYNKNSVKIRISIIPIPSTSGVTTLSSILQLLRSPARWIRPTFAAIPTRRCRSTATTALDAAVTLHLSLLLLDIMVSSPLPFSTMSSYHLAITWNSSRLNNPCRSLHHWHTRRRILQMRSL